MNDAELARALEAWAARSLEAAIAELARLAAVDAPSGDAEALRSTEELLTRRLEAMGGATVRHHTGAGTHLEARFGPPSVERLVLILGHYDTVWPRGTAVARPFRLEGDRAFGPGVFDMRGGLVASLCALEALNTLGALDRPVALLVTADEESGSESSRQLVVGLGSQAEHVLIPEPPLPGGRLKTSRKGTSLYRVEVRGRAAHAGIEPERGVNAVHELARLVPVLEELAAPEVGTTVNVGVLQGGSVPSVVPDSAFALVDVRVADIAEYERIDAAVRKLGPVRSGASLTVACLHERPPMERTPAIAESFEAARRIAALIGVGLEEGATGGASDGNFLAPLDVRLLDGLGPDGGGAHALDEHISIASLESRIVLLALLIALL